MQYDQSRDEVLMLGVGVIESSTPMSKYLDIKKAKSQCVYVTQFTNDAEITITKDLVK